MNLVVFDIDGTLIRSVELDDRCFVRAFADVLGIDGVSADWSRYPMATDSGLAREIVRLHCGRDPSDEEIELVRERCCQLLRHITGRSRTAIREVAGAGRLLGRLRQDAEWRAAIASGSWRDTACIKWQAAGLDLADLPGAYADDSPDRSEILLAAIRRAGEHYGAGRFAKVVYVGDGPWDVEAARQQGIAFLGLAGDSGTDALLKAGAREVIADFYRLEAVLQSLNEARVPR